MAAGGIIAAAAAAAHRQAVETANKAWASFAQATQMKHRPGNTSESHPIPPRVEGTLEELKVAFQLALVGGNQGTMFTVPPPNPLAVNIELTHEGLPQKIAKFFGAQDIVLGEHDFDKAFMVKGTDVALVKKLFQPQSCAELVALGVSTFAYRSSETHKAMLVFGVPRVVTEKAELDRLLVLLVALGHVS